MSVKTERAASIIKRTISAMLTTELADPRLGFATVTDVEVTEDLSYAKVYVSFLGQPEHREQGMRTLERAKGRIRSQVASRLSTRKCPELIFVYDDTYQKGERIDRLIDEIHEKQQ